MNPHESAFVESFVVQPRRQRAMELLASSNSRYRFTRNFDHRGRDYFLPECIRPIQARRQRPPDIKDILVSMGAPATCHVIGGTRDGEELDLLSALQEIVGYGQGTVLSCIPGQLAYFEGEWKERFLLVRKGS